MWVQRLKPDTWCVSENYRTQSSLKIFPVKGTIMYQTPITCQILYELPREVQQMKPMYKEVGDLLAVTEIWLCEGQSRTGCYFRKLLWPLLRSPGNIYLQWMGHSRICLKWRSGDFLPTSLSPLNSPYLPPFPAADLWAQD